LTLDEKVENLIQSLTEFKTCYLNNSHLKLC